MYKSLEQVNIEGEMYAGKLFQSVGHGRSIELCPAAFLAWSADRILNGDLLTGKCTALQQRLNQRFLYCRNSKL